MNKKTGLSVAELVMLAIIIIIFFITAFPIISVNKKPSTPSFTTSEAGFTAEDANFEVKDAGFTTQDVKFTTSNPGFKGIR